MLFKLEYPSYAKATTMHKDERETSMNGFLVKKNTKGQGQNLYGAVTVPVAMLFAFSKFAF